MTTIIEIWKVSTNFSKWRCLIVIFIHDKHTFCNFCHTRGISVAAVNNASGVIQKITLQWRHNGRDGVSNHQPHDRLLNRLYRCRSKKISNIRVTGLCVGNPAQMASDAENVSIWWCHHDHMINSRSNPLTCSSHHKIGFILIKTWWWIYRISLSIL